MRWLPMVGLKSVSGVIVVVWRKTTAPVTTTASTAETEATEDGDDDGDDGGDCGAKSQTVSSKVKQESSTMSKAAALCADQMKEQMKRSEKEKQAVKDRTNEVRKEIEARNTERDKLRETVKELGEGADRVAQQVQEARTKRDHLRGLLNSLKERKAKLEHTMAESENDLSQVTLGLGGVHKASSTHPTRAREHHSRPSPRAQHYAEQLHALAAAHFKEKKLGCAPDIDAAQSDTLNACLALARKIGPVEETFRNPEARHTRSHPDTAIFVCSKSSLSTG